MSKTRLWSLALVAGAGGALAVLVPACSGSSSPSSTSAAPSNPPSSSSCRSATSAAASGSGDVLVPGDIPDTQAFVPYQATGGYTVSVPEGWARSQTGAVTTFSDKFNAIRVEVVPAPTAPSIASAKATDVPALAASAPCFAAGKVSQVSRRAGPAILITYRADSSPDPVTGKVVRQDVERYEFWRAGKGEAVITLSTPQGSDNVDPWRKVTDSFAWSP